MLMPPWHHPGRLLCGLRTVLRPVGQGLGPGDSERTLRKNGQSHAAAAAGVVVEAFFTHTTGEEVEDLAGVLLARRR